MGRLSKRILYLAWFYCDMVLVLRLICLASGGRLPIPTADWRNAALLLGAMALTAAAVYPIFKRMEKAAWCRALAGLMAGAGYLYWLHSVFGQRPQMWIIGLPVAAAAAYVTVYGLKKQEQVW